MARADASQTAEAPQSAQRVDPGRLRSAWSVLRGQRLVPLQIQMEWLEYQQIFDDVLKRFSAQLARQARAEKDRLKKMMPEPSSEGRSQPDVHPLSDHLSRKNALRSRVARARGVPGPASGHQSASPQPTEEENP